MLEGIDVSHYQGNIDWHKVAQSGRRFAFIKATDGTSYVDSAYIRNRNGCIAAGMYPSAYHFYRANLDPIEQANHFAHIIMPVSQGQLQPAFDIEEISLEGWNGTPHQLRDDIASFLTEVNTLTGKDCIIYTDISFWRDQLENTVQFSSHYPLWLADWNASLTPRLVGGWKFQSFRQYSDNGHVPGINGPVDLDRFFGGERQLRKFAGYA